MEKKKHYENLMNWKPYCGKDQWKTREDGEELIDDISDVTCKGCLQKVLLDVKRRRKEIDEEEEKARRKRKKSR